MIINENQLTTIFCLIDDFCKEFEPSWYEFLLSCRSKDFRKKRSSKLSMSEVMTIAIGFHWSKFRTFKDYFFLCVQGELKAYFPGLPSYSQFVRLMQRCVFPLFVFLQGLLGPCTGISFIDSTILTVCNIRRASSHKVFAKWAKKGKTSTGWFYGFKLHLVINHRGEIIAFMFTQGNVDDRQPVSEITRKLFGKLFGDRGYISSKLFQELWNKGVQLITRLRNNMSNKLMDLRDKFFLRKRGLIESVHNKLKNSCQIEHHRHRSIWNFLVNLLGGLIAYCQDPLKPTLESKELENMLLAYSDAT